MQDDDTPQRRPLKRIVMSDDARAQRRDGRGFARGVPVRSDSGVPDPDDTSPHELWTRGASREDFALVEQLGRAPTEPLTVLEFAQFLRGDTRRREEYRSGNKELEAKLIALLDKPPHVDVLKLQDEVADLQRHAKFAKWVIGFILTAALGSLATGVGTLWSRAEHEGEIRVKIERLQDDVQQLLREQRHRYQPPKDSP